MSKSTPAPLEQESILDAPNFDESQLLHLLRRSLIGLTQSDIAAFEGLSREAAIAQILEPLPFPDPPINNYQVNYPDKQVPKGETWINAITGWALEEPEGDLESGRIQSLMYWLLRNLIGQQPRIHYKMLLFWHNHLATEAFTVFDARSSYQYFRTLWNLSLGNFKALIKAITIDSNMLRYLNGTENVKEQPDENYSRELQELFCIGKGPEANYTEEDIREAARILTGWKVDWESTAQVGEVKSGFAPWAHDTQNKQFSSFYNHKLILGKSGENGALELDELIDMIVEHPECARFICRKLYRYFVHHEIDEIIEVEVIEPLANLFRDSNYEIAPVMEALLLNDHFYAQPGATIKSPVDNLLGFWRSVGIKYPSNGDPIDEDYYTHQAIHWNLQELGFNLGNPPNVSGWPAYYQFPSYDKLWINVSSLINRIRITDDFIYWGFWTPSERVTWDFVEYTQSLENAADPNALIEEVLKIHLAVPIDDSIKNRLKGILLSNQQTDDYWTIAWTDYLNNPNDEMTRGVVEQRLRFFYLNLFQLPEYQLH